MAVFDSSLITTNLIEDSDDDEVESVHSAISNMSDFDDDEQVEYLAMELVNHLPSEQACKLLKNMRAKEKAVQDLLHRNRSLLTSCQQLDGENQSLTDRLQDSGNDQSTTAPPSSVNVDLQFFQKMEKSKEETIIGLLSQRDELTEQVKELKVQNEELKEFVSQAQREAKKVLQQQQALIRAANSTDCSAGFKQSEEGLMDEEERIFQELQTKSGNSSAEDRKDTSDHAMLQQFVASVHNDISNVKHWSSDVSAVLLAVDGLEASGRSGGKNTQKKGKSTPVGGSMHASLEQMQKSSQGLRKDLEILKESHESVNKLHAEAGEVLQDIFQVADDVALRIAEGSGLSLVDRELHDLCVTIDGPDSMLESGMETLGQAEAALQQMLFDSPPGLLPQVAETLLRETRQQISDLCEQMAVQARAWTGLQVKNTDKVRSIQAAHQEYSVRFQEAISEEFRSTSAAMWRPLDKLHEGLKKQQEIFSRVHNQANSLCESAIASGRATATADNGLAGSANGASNESLQSNLREVRGMCRSLDAAMQEGVKELEQRAATLQKSLDDLGIEEKAETPAGSACKNQRCASEVAAPEAKKKKGKKKQKNVSNGAPAETPHQEPAKVQNSGQDNAGQVNGHSDQGPEGSHDRGSQGNGARHVLSGPALLQEMQLLRDSSDKLEARMAQRMQTNKNLGMPPADSDLDPAPKKVPKGRRKNLFV